VIPAVVRQLPHSVLSYQWVSSPALSSIGARRAVFSAGAVAFRCSLSVTSNYLKEDIQPDCHQKRTSEIYYHDHLGDDINV
jgi:hypothetical protein